MTQLQAVFRKLAEETRKLDDAASTILAAIRDENVSDVDQFNAQVIEAYAANGWNATAGRPRLGVEVVPVPDAIRAYVSDIRSAFELGLDVLSFHSMYALRKAARAARAEATRGAQGRTRPLWQQLPELQGVRLDGEGEGEYTGALFHDLLVTYAKAGDDTRERMQRRVKKLLNEFRVALGADESGAEAANA